jgi:hypothetical protein
MLLAGCASQQPQSGAPVLSDTPNPKAQVNKDRDRALYECEREAAFAGPGDKRQVFDRCMNARGYAPSSTDRLEWPHTE